MTSLSCHMRGQRRLMLIAVSVSTALALTACAGSDDSTEAGRADQPSTSPSQTPKGAVTRQEAAAIVDKYEAVNSQANAKQDEKLLGTVEGGQLLEQNTADYEQWETRTAKDQKRYATPFRYISRDYYIPAGQTWFAVKATVDDTKAVGLLIFDQLEGLGWRKVAALFPGDGKKPAALPAIDTSNHGLATAVNRTTRTGAMTPNQISAAYEDLYATGGQGGGRGLAPTWITREATKIYKERNSGKEANFTETSFDAIDPAHQAIYALKLKDGGTLAMIPTAHTRRYELKAEFIMNYTITPTNVEAIYNPAKRVSVVNEFQGMALAQLPTNGKPSLIGREYRMVDSQ
ncbi:hypothetical protein AB0H69_41360 [Streptomyces phaeochromogenes]|uniref:hypothetical protein n=1 Tax=Streptomyces phaeochromogenes TaxID=1923 RepID=UPI0033DD9A13